MGYRCKEVSKVYAEQLSGRNSSSTESGADPACRVRSRLAGPAPLQSGICVLIWMCGSAELFCEISGTNIALRQ